MKLLQKNKEKEARVPKPESYEVMHFNATPHETLLGIASTATCIVAALVIPFEPSMKQHESTILASVFYGAGYVTALATNFNVKPFRS